MTSTSTSSIDSELKSASNSVKWRKSVETIIKAKYVSNRFCTLRDMYQDIIIDEENLQILKKLGAGQFGTVYKCSYQGKFVALKFLNDQFASTDDEAMFLKEVQLLKKLRHPNIIGYFGTGYKMVEGKNQLFLAQDCINGGSLQGLLLKQQVQGYRKPIYSILQAYNWVCDIAKGLEYLHKSLPMIIHRDLKLENILLQKKQNQTKAVIVDFGLHTLINQQAANKKNVYDLTGKTGSYVYMAPEVFLKQAYNEKVDVYSFAVIAYELFSRTMISVKVAPSGTPKEVINYACRAAFGFRQPTPTNWPQQLQELVQECWQQEATQRPSFDIICQKLNDMQPEINNWHMEQANQKACSTIM